MKPISKRTLIATVLATAIAGLSVTAIAQGLGAMNPELHAQHMAQRAQGEPDAQTMELRLQQRQARMQTMHAERLAQLKAELKITPAQEAAWNAYIARSTPVPPKAPPAAEDWSKLTTPQRLDRMQALKAERDAEMGKRIEATKSFYAQLAPEQQRVFDAQGGGFHRAGMKGEHRMGGHGGHGRQGGGQPGMGGMGCGMGGEGGPMPGGMPGPSS